MSKLLGELLGANGSALPKIIERLEYASGHPNIDVRLSAEIIGLTRMKIKELGLDAGDTNGRELFHSLQLLVAKHNKFLVNLIEGNSDHEGIDLIKLKNTAAKLDLPKGCWTQKNTAAKKLLKKIPPRHAMKCLKYKSVDSMLKRERPANIYIAIRLTESSAWQEAFIKSYKDLRPNDFTQNDVSIIAITDRRLIDVSQGFVRANRHNILSIKELGLIALLPLPTETIRGAHLVILSILIGAINDMRAHSTYLKLQQVKPDFGEIICQTLLGKSPGFKVAGQRLPWRIIQQFLSRLENIYHPDIFGPHLQPEDVAWHKPEDVLYRLEPALKFWENIDFAAVNMDECPVSFNLLDNALSYCNNLKYGNQSVNYFQDNLQSELYLRYLLETPLGERTLNILDDALVGEHAELFEEVSI